MSSVVQHLRSEVASSRPAPSNLAAGQIAVNINDQRAYTKDSSGSIVELCPYDKLLSTANSWVNGQTFVGVTETTFDLVADDISAANGTILYKTLTAPVTLTSSLAEGDSVTLLLFGGDANAVTFPTATWLTSQPTTLSPTHSFVLAMINGTLYIWDKGGV